MRQAKVFYQDKLAGLITENDEGYFLYMIISISKVQILNL